MLNQNNEELLKMSEKSKDLKIRNKKLCWIDLIA